MITFVFVGLVVAIFVMQFLVTPKMADHLYYNYSFDTDLAEPGEKISYMGRLSNSWFLPIIYITFALSLPDKAVISDTNKNNKSYRIFLLPLHSNRHVVVFSLPRRGIYKGGRYFLETGDFLGFRSFVRSGKIVNSITVMPRKCEDELILQTLGGYIGDISVRRFIIEDPVLTTGYRDYTGREPMKKISWSHSARAGKLVVKNNDYTVDASVAVALNMDCGTPMEKEKSLEIARTVCEQLEQKRIPYTFISNGDVKNKDEGFGPKHLHGIMMDLGKSELFAYSDFDSLIDACIKGRKDNRSYIIVSPLLSKNDRASLKRLSKFSQHEPCLLEAEVT